MTDADKKAMRYDLAMAALDMLDRFRNQKISETRLVLAVRETLEEMINHASPEQVQEIKNKVKELMRALQSQQGLEQVLLDVEDALQERWC